MKQKQIRIIRPEVEVEFIRPVISRLYFLLILPRLFKVKKIILTINTPDGPAPAGKVYIIVIPKFRFSDTKKGE